MFYARKTVTQAPPDRLDVAKKVIEEQVIENALKIPGFVGGYWLADSQTGKGLGFTFFDSQESLEDSADAATKFRTEAAGNIGADVKSVEHFEVVAKTGDKIHEGAGFARVIEFSGDTAQLEAAITRINEIVIPEAQQIKGFLGGFWVADRKTGKGTGVTLYDTKENLEGSLATANKIRTESAQATGATVGESNHFEVIARASK